MIRMPCHSLFESAGSLKRNIQYGRRRSHEIDRGILPAGLDRVRAAGFGGGQTLCLLGQEMIPGWGLDVRRVDGDVLHVVMMVYWRGLSTHTVWMLLASIYVGVTSSLWIQSPDQTGNTLDFGRDSNDRNII